MTVVRENLTQVEANELMKNIRRQDPRAELELVRQADGLFTLNIQRSAPARRPSTLAATVVTAPHVAEVALPEGSPRERRSGSSSDVPTRDDSMSNGGFRKDWQTVSQDERVLYVMTMLVETHGYPENGAAGLVGNLMSESGVLPNRIERSASATPMTAANFHNVSQTFTPEEIMNRNAARRHGPKSPGVGLAQWTAPARRKGLFAHRVGTTQRGAEILFDMDAQVDYLVTELATKYRLVDRLLRSANVTLNDASDEVVYSFEIPGSVLGPDRHKLPRNHESVQKEFRTRRINGNKAAQIYRNPHR